MLTLCTICSLMREKGASVKEEVSCDCQVTGLISYNFSGAAIPFVHNQILLMKFYSYWFM